MGGASIPGAGGKRSMDVDINLVPFIDMMSCLLSFLMLTVVWNKLAKIDIDSPLPKASTNPEKPEEPPKDIALFIDAAGYSFMVTNDNPVKPLTPVPVVLRREEGKLPYAKLVEKLTELQKALPPKVKESPDPKNPKATIKVESKHSSIIIGARYGMRYDDVVGTMDAVRGIGLEGIVINMETDSPMVPLVAAISGAPAGG
ncbi:MAG: biopolymer transporter ExbD [Myxococcales bacterium]|nr:biopolymer transporter ExbD [Myxococcales bacterium]